MTSAFNYFEKIYCINLDSRPDRWNEVQQEFEALGVSSYERFPGVIAHSGRLGCSRAICGAIDKALAEECRAVLICEDDLHFPRGGEYTNRKLQAAISQLPEDWDALYLGATLTNQFHAKPVEKYSADLLKLKSAFTTHAIAYSRKGLLAFKQAFEPSDSWGDSIVAAYEAIDVYLAKDYLHKNNCYITNELLSFQRPSHSDICNNYQDYIGLMQGTFDHFTSV
jgi:GR25 family glycosyltransferase involved in LPS biosynthesis